MTDHMEKAGDLACAMLLWSRYIFNHRMLKMKPDERNRRRRHGKSKKSGMQNSKSQNTKGKGACTDLESFRTNLPDVEPIRTTEAAMYYYAQPKGWWFEPACPLHPEAIGPFTTLQEAMSSGERGCLPCNEANCTARIKSTQENQKSPENMRSADRPSPRTPGRCQVITLKAKPRSWPIIPRRQRER